MRDVFQYFHHVLEFSKLRIEFRNEQKYIVWLVEEA